MKKRFRLIASLFLCLVCLFAFAACAGTQSTGTKYAKTTDQNSYIVLNDGKWNLSDGLTAGTYKEEGGVITFYFGSSGQTIYATGTIENTTLTLTLTEGSASVSYTRVNEDGNFFSKYGMVILLGVILVLIIVWLLFSGRKNKQRQKEYTEQLEALAPGNKVKTAGGICGVVVEICDDNTVILETGSEAAGKSFIKMDKELIAQTDAKGPTQIARERVEAERKAAKEEKKTAPAEEPAPETPSDEQSPDDEEK